MTRSLRRCFILLACLAALPGCSMLFVDGPPPDYAQRPYFDCTTSRLAPVTDTIFAAFYGLGGVAVAAAPSDFEIDSSTRTSVAVVYIGWATFLAVSAVGGFNDTDACDAATDELNQRRSAQPPQWYPNGAPQQQPVPNAGCTTDVQCKMDRVCVQGVCMDYTPPPQHAPLPPPGPHDAPVLLFADPPPPPPTAQPAP